MHNYFFADSSDVFVMVKMSIKNAQRSNLQIVTREVKNCNFYNFQVLIKNQPKNIYVSEMHQIKGNFVYYTNK